MPSLLVDNPSASYQSDATSASWGDFAGESFTPSFARARIFAIGLSVLVAGLLSVLVSQWLGVDAQQKPASLGGGLSAVLIGLGVSCGPIVMLIALFDRDFRVQGVLVTKDALKVAYETTPDFFSHRLRNVETFGWNRVEGSAIQFALADEEGEPVPVARLRISAAESPLRKSLDLRFANSDAAKQWVEDANRFSPANASSVRGDSGSSGLEAK